MDVSLSMSGKNGETAGYIEYFSLHNPKKRQAKCNIIFEQFFCSEAKYGQRPQALM